MKFSAQRESFLEPLSQVIGAVERRQTSPVLGNVLVQADEHGVVMTASDSEIELRATSTIAVERAGATTIPARKLFEICRHLPEQARIELELDGEKVKLRAGRSRFTLATLPAEQFPVTAQLEGVRRIVLPAASLLACVRATAFSMALQDVRFYLNGMLLEIGADGLCSVATDGHRLAWARAGLEGIEGLPEADGEAVRAIVPRKSVGELQRLLGAAEDNADVTLELTAQQLRASLGGVRLTTRLIDGRFPDYNRVIPVDGDKELLIDGRSLRQALTRASVLSNEKYRGIRLALGEGVLTISSNNPDQEEAIDELEIDYSGPPTEIGFNVTYLLEVLGAIETENARIVLKDGNSSALVTPESDESSRYVVMPMRL